MGLTMASDDEPGASAPAVLTRHIMGDQIRARLAGSLSAKALASWAFDSFYAEDMGELVLEPGAEEVLAETLDELMFADDDAFALDEAALRSLLERIGA
jgi:hypothetical protein